MYRELCAAINEQYIASHGAGTNRDDSPSGVGSGRFAARRLPPKCQISGLVRHPPRHEATSPVVQML
jgi:hypothetical protein